MFVRILSEHVASLAVGAVVELDDDEPGVHVEALVEAGLIELVDEAPAKPKGKRPPAKPKAEG